MSRSKPAFVRSNPIGLAVIVLSFPKLPAILGIARIACLARFFRLIRLTGVTVRAISCLGATLGRKGFLYVAGLSLFVLVAGGSALAVLEPNTVTLVQDNF